MNASENILQTIWWVMVFEFFLLFLEKLRPFMACLHTKLINDLFSIFCWLFLLMKIVCFCDYISVIWVWLKPLKVSLSQKMFTRFERILKLFLSPLLSTFKLYNTQPNLQQKSAMVWQGFMLQVRLQRFFCKSERKFNFCPPFLCKNVKNWNCICKWDFF